MNTEITDTSDSAGILFYDADCRACTRLAAWARPWLAVHRFRLLPLQTPGCQEKLGRTSVELSREMWLLLPDGHSIGGADALLEISRSCWWTGPIRLAAKLPPILAGLRTAYYWIARHRTCANGACAIRMPVPPPPVRRAIFPVVDLLPVLILPMAILGLRNQMPAWIFMWVLALALYAGSKWLTYREALQYGLNPARWRVAAYLFAWLGMDARDFLDRGRTPDRPLPIEWVIAAGKAVLGLVLVWIVARREWPAHPVLTGWIGMVGVTLILHFGLFQLLALAWQRASVKATPLMNKPLRARSLAEFWGRRWNTAFNELAFRLTFRPLLSLLPPVVGLLVVFGLSGLVHDLVISVPARAGYGLPTAYFLIQALGMLAERSSIGRRMGLGRGVRGWLFTVIVTAGPAYWLFPPPFIKNVILPMLTAIGSL